ncbi:MAG: signal recognition particle receptor subunit alpha, partial [Pararhodobacter sp.]
MSFFGKLKDRMFRSSSKLDESLDALVSAEPAPAPEAPKPGLLARLTGRPEAPRRVLDDAFIEELEDLLVQADLGVETALKVTANIAAGRFGKRVSTGEIKQALADEIARIMTPVARPLPLYPKKPQVVL